MYVIEIIDIPLPQNTQFGEIVRVLNVYLKKLVTILRYPPILCQCPGSSWARVRHSLVPGLEMSS